MKRFVILIILVLFTISINCQIPFSWFDYTIIDSEYDHLRSGVPIDVDNDNDVDIIAVNWSNLFWYENDQDYLFIKHTISNDIYCGNSVYAIDIDFDLDIDIITSSDDGFSIAYYENDGNQNFTQQTISTTSMNLNCVYAIDIDADNDIDILTSSSGESMIMLYLNNGNNNFTETIIDSTIVDAGSVFSIDLDQDSDLDIISATSSYSSSNYLKWYENISNEFIEHELPLGIWRPRAIYCIDFDYDTDIDILLALGGAYNSDKVVFFENMGPQNNYYFEEQVLIFSTNISGLVGITAADYDNDSDMDLVISESYDAAPQSLYRRMYFCENDGLGNLTANWFDLDQAGFQLYSIDMDNDTDLDIVSIGGVTGVPPSDARSGIFNNSNITGSVNNDLITLNNMLTNFPNPFNPSTTISFSIQSDTKVNLSIYNIKGKLVKTLVNNKFTKGSHSIIWDGDDESGNSVSSGIYYYKLNDYGKTESVKKCLLLK